MRLNSFWMAALVTAGILGANSTAFAASDSSTAAFRVNCTTQACASLPASFAGRLDWYSGLVLVYSETGTFGSSPSHDLLVTLSGNGSPAVFQVMYQDAAT